MFLEFFLGVFRVVLRVFFCFEFLSRFSNAFIKFLGVFNNSKLVCRWIHGVCLILWSFGGVW